MVNLGPMEPMMQKPITVRYRDMGDGTHAQVVAPQTGALKRSPPNRYRGDPIILHGAASYGPFIEPSKSHYAFICEYCGRASQSVEPCQGCGALRTREQLYLWARGSR